MNRYHIQRGSYLVGIFAIAAAICVTFISATSGALTDARTRSAEARTKSAEAEKMMQEAKALKEDVAVKVRVEIESGSKTLKRLFEARRESLKALNAPKEDYDRLADDYKSAKAQGLIQ